MVRYSAETQKTPLKISLLPMALVSVTMPLARQWSSSAAPSRPSDRDMVSEKVRSFSATCRSKDTVCPQHRFSTSSAGSVSASEEMVRHTFRQPARWVTSLQRVKIFRGFSIRLSSNSISVSTTTWAHRPTLPLAPKRAWRIPVPGRRTHSPACRGPSPGRCR